MSIKHGFGIIEILVALGLFGVVGLTGLSMILHSFTVSRLGEEQTIASNISLDGLEIVKLLRNQNWSNLVSGTYGLKNLSGVWSFSSTPESWNRYTRTITIEDAHRDGSGNLVNSGGTVDSNTKKVTATTTWDTTPLRNNSIVLVSYLTNFTKSIGATIGTAILAWRNTTTTPKINYYTNTTNSFQTFASLPVGESARYMLVKSSPTKAEAIIGYLSSTGVLRILCYNGTTWAQDWSVSLGGTGTTRRFDFGYETNTGDAMVVYSTNTATTNELAYRTKPGTSTCGSGSWSAATSLNPVRTSGIIQWVKLAEDPGVNQNVLGLIWADAASDLSAMLWDGTAWVNEPTAVTDANIERVTTSQDVESFDLTFESLTGNLMLVWGTTVGANANGVRYRRCTGGTAYCTWGAVTTPPTFVDDATNLDISSNPASNEIVFASIGNAQSDLQVGYWSGTTWTNTANRDTSCTIPAAGSQKVATGWLTSGATKRSVVVYQDSGATGINWYVGSVGVFTAQTDSAVAPAFTASQGNYQIAMDPTSPDRLLLAEGDNSLNLYVKRLVMTSVPAFTWTDANTGTALETSLGQSLYAPFGLTYWRHQ